MKNNYLFPVIIILMLSIAACGGGGDAPKESTGTNTGNSNAPVLSSISDKTVLAGQSVTINLSATDPNSTGIDYTADGTVGPGGNPFMVVPTAVFDMSGHVFTWTTSSAVIGDYNVEFTATDRSATPLSDSDNVTIHVLSEIDYGDSLYVQFCQSCHGVDGKGGSAIQVVGTEEITLRERLGLVSGISGVGAMVGIPSQLDNVDVDVAAISAFLCSLPGAACAP